MLNIKLDSKTVDDKTSAVSGKVEVMGDRECVIHEMAHVFTAFYEVNKGAFTLALGFALNDLGVLDNIDEIFREQDDDED